MIKLLGSAIIVICSYTFGKILCMRERSALAQSEAFLRLIRHIRLQIFCFKTPVSEIISAYKDDELLALGFTDLFRESFNEALENCGHRLFVDNETLEILKAFGRELGAGYKDEQVACCDYYTAKLEEHISALNKDLPGRERMLCTCALVFGAFAIIILI